MKMNSGQNNNQKDQQESSVKPSPNPPVVSSSGIQGPSSESAVPQDVMGRVLAKMKKEVEQGVGDKLKELSNLIKKEKGGV